MEIRYYMNFNRPALCNGRITSWEYCYYYSFNQEVRGNNNDFSARFFVYRRINSDSQLYKQVPGSALTVILKAEQVQTVACARVDLNSAQQFQVEVNDIIGACIIFNGTINPLYSVGEYETGGLYQSDVIFPHRAQKGLLILLNLLTLQLEMIAHYTCLR